MTFDIVHAARALATELREGTVRIRRKTGTVKNPANGRLEDTWTVIYEGPGRLRQSNAQPRDLDTAGQRLVEQSPTVSLPVDDEDPRVSVGSSGEVDVDDIGEVLTSPYDPGRVGQRFRVAGTHDQTHSSARRLPVEVFTHAKAQEAT